jgi:sugar O-acyltransferase (sialic acid O-acetyltransferase NeuD family)
MSQRELVVIGAAGFGRETLDVLDAVNARPGGPRWSLVGVLDDAVSPHNRHQLERRRVPHLGPVDEWASAHPPISYVIGINDPSVRKRLATTLDAYQHSAATLIHPSVICGFGVEWSPGVVVCAGVQLSTNVRLGAHVQINPGAIVGHDTVIEDFVSINPGAVISGSCVLEGGSLIGAAAVVLQGLRIGCEAVVGAAACVTHEVGARAVVKGVPAR